LRAQYYKLIASQERWRQELLEQAAADEHKIYRPIRYSTDSDHSGDTWARIVGFGKDLLARLPFRRFHDRDVEKWLTKPESFDLQARSMEADLRDQQEFLRQLTSLRDGIQDPGLEPDVELNNRCQEVLNEIKIDSAVCEELSRIVVSEPLSRIRKEYLQLQNEFFDGGRQRSEDSYEKNLLQGETHFRNRRGQLLAIETELAKRRQEPGYILPQTWESVHLQDLYHELAFVGSTPAARSRPAARAVAELRRAEPAGLPDG
jgi:hypothetical protein